MASFDIEGFPRHHRVLHVKQEVQASEDSVLQVRLHYLIVLDVFGCLYYSVLWNCDICCTVGCIAIRCRKK
jgi:hypothetical protein